MNRELDPLINGAKEEGKTRPTTYAILGLLVLNLLVTTIILITSVTQIHSFKEEIHDKINGFENKLSDSIDDVKASFTFVPSVDDVMDMADAVMHMQYGEAAENIKSFRKPIKSLLQFISPCYLNGTRQNDIGCDEFWEEWDDFMEDFTEKLKAAQLEPQKYKPKSLVGSLVAKVVDLGSGSGFIAGGNETIIEAAKTCVSLMHSIRSVQWTDASSLLFFGVSIETGQCIWTNYTLRACESMVPEDQLTVLRDEIAAKGLVDICSQDPCVVEQSCHACKLKEGCTYCPTRGCMSTVNATKQCDVPTVNECCGSNNWQDCDDCIARADVCRFCPENSDYWYPLQTCIYAGTNCSNGADPIMLNTSCPKTTTSSSTTTTT